MDQPKAKTFDKINEWQQLGYEAWIKNKRGRACSFWKIAWDLVAELMNDRQFASLEALDKAYHGKQSLSSWTVDYGEALYLAGLRDPLELPASIAFNRQVLAWSSRPNDLNNYNRRRMVGESIFRTEGAAAGDAVYEQYLTENPSWGWGWASWADQYGFDRYSPWYDPARAEQILHRALQLKGIDNRDLILQRLRDVLIRQGRQIEADGIETATQHAASWRKWRQRSRDR